jgi:hypothetical protein
MTTAEDFRRIAITFEGTEERGHGRGRLSRGRTDFRDPCLAGPGLRESRVTPEVQALFMEEATELFVSIAGGWGPMGMTHIRLVTADDAALTGALRKAWTLRMEKNTRTRPGPRSRRRARAPGR